MKFRTIIGGVSLILILSTSVFGQQIRFVPQEKQRVIVLTDITNEPDDQQSLVRFLVYSNEYDVEGIVATTSVHLKNRVRKDKIDTLILAYAQVKPNLDRHARGFPTADHLMRVTKAHLPLYGMSGVGEGKDSDGSELIIQATDRNDRRPLWISVWGGASCLAQALWKVKATRSTEELETFVSKLRVYTISDQDDAGRWIRNNFPNLFYVVSPSAEHWLEYYRATWTGISGDRHYKNGPMFKFEMVDNPWLSEHVMKGHGPLGALYPKLEYIMEGDTPSFIGLINNGLGSALSPAYGGWSGRYDFFQSYAEAGKIWTNNHNTIDVVTLEDGKTYASDQATIWRWREDFQNDFAARMDWCVAGEFNKANHNPIVDINGNSTKDVMMITAKEGSTLTLNAGKSSDPDGDRLSYYWFVYNEAGGYKGKFNLEKSESNSLSIQVPPIPEAESLHIICRVRDNGIPSLTSYRRIIIKNP